jgi:uncharacterized protein (DUF2336 family)
MTEPKSLLAELEDAISNGTTESCLQALWHATDVLIAGRYSEDEIWTFGEIIARLADEIELAARVRLANKLAPSNNAPINIVKKLAFDDSIDVAGPMFTIKLYSKAAGRRLSGEYADRCFPKLDIYNFRLSS